MRAGVPRRVRDPEAALAATEAARFFGSACFGRRLTDFFAFAAIVLAVVAAVAPTFAAARLVLFTASFAFRPALFARGEAATFVTPAEATRR